MGMADGPTYSKLGSSALSSSGSVARPKAQSWRKMYEPLAWTASTTCEKGRSDRKLLAGANEVHLLPGLDLCIGVDIRSVEVRPGRGMDGGGLCYQKRSRD